MRPPGLWTYDLMVQDTSSFSLMNPRIDGEDHPGFPRRSSPLLPPCSHTTSYIQWVQSLRRTELHRRWGLYIHLSALDYLSGVLETVVDSSSQCRQMSASPMPRSLGIWSIVCLNVEASVCSTALILDKNLLNEWTKECWYAQLYHVEEKQFCLEGTICIRVSFLLRVSWKGDNY